MASRTESVAWFGTFTVPLGEARAWHVGPLQMVLRHDPHEWRVSRRRRRDPLEDSLEVAVPVTGPEDAEAEITRFGFRASPDQIVLTPRLADRPVVVDTVRPFVLPPEEDVTLYLSTPLWLQVGLEDNPVLDEPIFRPSDTWFGPDTQVGELCYASTTSARLELANLPRRPHRAITAVEIHNRASTRVELKSLKFPMPHLSLFADTSDGLWTEALVYEREEDGEDASVQLEKAPPPEAGKVRAVSSAREVAREGLLTRVFGGLLELGR